LSVSATKLCGTTAVLGRIFQKRVFKMAWLSASILVGTLAIVGGVFQAARGHFDGMVGILGGGILVSIGFVGLRGLARPLHKRI
jgi:hypothetical protein